MILQGDNHLILFGSGRIEVLIKEPMIKYDNETNLSFWIFTIDPTEELRELAAEDLTNDGFFILKVPTHLFFKKRCTPQFTRFFIETDWNGDATRYSLKRQTINSRLENAYRESASLTKTQSFLQNRLDTIRRKPFRYLRLTQEKFNLANKARGEFERESENVD